MRSIHPAQRPLDCLFVYGTLKRGLPAHRRFCTDATFLVNGAVRGRLHLHPHGYPVLLLPPSTSVASREWGWVEGEILRVKNATSSLARIDEYEGIVAGVTGQYHRVRVPVRAAGVRAAWVYAAASARHVAELPTHPRPSWP